MKIPEKVYVTECMLFATNPEITLPKNGKIEYIRKDVFIKKADEFISTFFHPDDTELIDAVLNRFHEHMKLK